MMTSFELTYNRLFRGRGVDTRHIAECEQIWDAAVAAASSASAASTDANAPGEAVAEIFHATTDEGSHDFLLRKLLPASERLPLGTTRLYAGAQVSTPAEGLRSLGAGSAQAQDQRSPASPDSRLLADAVFDVKRLGPGMRRLDWVREVDWANLPEGRYELRLVEPTQPDGNSH